MVGPDSLQREINIIFKAATEAGLLCRELRMASYEKGASSLGIMTKTDESPVTCRNKVVNSLFNSLVADISSQILINFFIKSEFPEDLIIGEEESTAISDELFEGIKEIFQGSISFHPESKEQLEGILRMSDANKCSSRYWAVDPIDGTKGFIRGDQYAVCIALVDGKTKKPVLSALACPNLPFGSWESKEQGLVLLAVKDHGLHQCFLGSSMQSLEKVPLPCLLENLNEIRFTGAFESTHTDPKEIEGIRDRIGGNLEILRMDSQCKYAVLSLNWAQAYYRRHRNTTLESSPDTPNYSEYIWDNAPGYLMVTESGGQVTDFEGNDLSFPATKKFIVHDGIFASILTPEAHAQILGVFKKMNR